MKKKRYIVTSHRNWCEGILAIFDSKEELLATLYESYQRDMAYLRGEIPAPPGKKDTDPEEVANFLRLWKTFQKWFRSTYTSFGNVFIMEENTDETFSTWGLPFERRHGYSQEKIEKETLFKMLDEYEAHRKEL